MPQEQKIRLNDLSIDGVSFYVAREFALAMRRGQEIGIKFRSSGSSDDAAENLYQKTSKRTGSAPSTSDTRKVLVASPPREIQPPFPLICREAGRFVAISAVPLHFG